MLSLQEVVTRVYENLSVDTDSTTYGLNTRVIPKINSVMHRILSDRKFEVLINDSTYHPFIKGGDLQFLRGSYMFERKPTYIVNEESEAGDKYVYFSLSANLPTKGRCLLDGMIYQFTTYKNTTKQYVKLDEELPIDIHAGMEFEILYAIPSNAEDTYQLFSIAENREVEMLYSDYRYPGDFNQYRTILYKNSTRLIRIVATYAWYTSKFKLNYYQKVDTLTELTDTTLFPDERRDTDVLALLTAGELLRETEKSDDATVKLNEGYGNLVLFYDKYATTNKGYRNDLGWNRNLQHNSVII